MLVQKVEKIICFFISMSTIRVSYPILAMFMRKTFVNFFEKLVNLMRSLSETVV